jgi:hypothetical protein
LNQVFPSLYLLSSQQQGKIIEMGFSNADGWRWCFNWSRDLSSLEEDMVKDLLELLHPVVLQNSILDSQKWMRNSLGDYSTLLGYRCLLHKFAEIEPVEDIVLRSLKLHGNLRHH